MKNNITLHTQTNKSFKVKLRLKKICKSKGIKLIDVAKAVGKTQVTFSRITTGVSPLNLELLQKIAEYLNVSVHELLEVEDGFEHYYGTKTNKWLGIRKID
tara:strand:- start:1978 stop:2280 length:303 start_codon:yes stop_codon:yes gene_type:complete